jgi:serine/threonine protein kinase
MKKVNKSDYIVKYYGSYFSRKTNTIWLILEYCSSGSAIDLMLSMVRTFSEVEVATIMEMILKGLILMHSENLIHRDIKGANILISEDGYAKLGDFGVGASLSDEKYRISKKGSPYWMSPQVASGIKYDFKTDIWSLGITCIELLEGEPPLSDLKPKNVMEKISKNPPSASEIIDLNEHTPEFKSFVEHCLEIDPNKRLSARDLLKHNFIIKFSKGRKYLEKLVKQHQDDVENFRFESEKEYQKAKKKEEYEEFDDNIDECLDSNIYQDISAYGEKRNLSMTNNNENNIDFENLESLDKKLKKIININKKHEIEINKNKKEGNINNSLVICYTESINTLEEKSSISNEKDNIIILDKNIKKNKNKNKIKKNNDDSLLKNIIKYMKIEEKNKNIPTLINDKSEFSGSCFKSSTSENSKREYVIEKKEIINENSLIENINEELPETKREKIPKKSLYKNNNISYIDYKYKIAEENIDDNDDEGFIRKTNESITSLKGMDFYKYNEYSKSDVKTFDIQ